MTVGLRRQGGKKMDVSGIPMGEYCYEALGVKVRDDGAPVMKVRLCPHWQRTSDGLVRCDFTGAEGVSPEHARYVKDLEASRAGRKTGSLVLWDQVKECGINVSRNVP